MAVRAAIATSGLMLAIVLAACTANDGASPSAAPDVSSTPPPATPIQAAAVVEVRSVDSIGTVLVDGTSGMTVYTFTRDVRGSGVSACTGDCLEAWPPLTVPAGAVPTAGSGIPGTVGTITRGDGTLHVTYDGLPLYFYAGDQAPGDATGVYPEWEAVVISGQPAPGGTPAGTPVPPDYDY